LPFGTGPVPPTRGFKPRALMLGCSRFRHRPSLAGPPSGRSRGRSVTLPIRLRVASRREALPNQSRRAGHRSPAVGCKTASPGIRTAIARRWSGTRPVFERGRTMRPASVAAGIPDAPACRAGSPGCGRRMWTAEH